MKPILCLLGSRNENGLTAASAEALLTGVDLEDVPRERVFLPTLNLERCRQCELDGWGICQREGRCVVDDDFGPLVGRLRAASGLIVATPVYFSDMSESLKAFLDRLRRIASHPKSRSEGIEGTPVIGLSVAGGGGGGAPRCARSMERVLLDCGFDVVDTLSARRQFLQRKLPTLRATGRAFAHLTKTRP